MTARRFITCLFIVLQGMLPGIAYAQQAPPVTRNMSVQARIPSTPENFQLQFSANKGTAHQDDTVTYTITYGSGIGNDTAVLLTANWDRGTRADNNGSVDIASYVDGSATKGYGDTPAVVDLVNRKVTWNITSFPGDTTGKTVSFTLRMANVSESIPIQFSVHANMTIDEVTMPQKSVTTTYEYDPTRLTPTPTPTTGPLTPTPTPLGQGQQLFLSVTIQSISSAQATIAIATNNPATHSVQYGLSPAQLSETIRSLTATKYQTITFPTLLPNTQYYFQITSKDVFGHTRVSDMFTFQTAATSESSTVSLPSIVITSDNKVMTTRFDAGEPETGLPPFVVLPRNVLYEVQFSLDQKTPIKTVQLMTRNKNLLGDFMSLFTKEAFAAPLAIDMVEVRSGVFVARVEAPNDTGRYELFAKIADYKGNLAEQKVAEMHITPPFTVLDTKDTPIEKARILLYVFRKSTNSFERIGNHSIANPSYTNYLGESDMVLPPGQYKAHVSALGYLPQDVIFTIGQNNTKGYPLLKLSEDTFAVVNTVFYLKDTASDMLSGIITSMQELTESSRVFTFMILVILFVFVVLTFIAFFIKTHTHPKAGLAQLTFMLHHAIDRNAKKQYVVGIVIDKKSHEAISQTKVFILDDNTRNVLYETFTNKKGSFVLKKPLKHYHIMAVKQGYEPAILYPNSTDLLYIPLHANTATSMVKTSSIHLSHRVFSMLFESLLVFCLIAELFFTKVFGIEKTWPFIIFSLVNIALWFYYLSFKHRKHI